VGELQDRLAGVDRALEQTAQEFLDRLLDAFDPDAAKAYVGQKGLKPSAFYKASVYDALCEKFAQLREYHRRGRLVRDFRATFKNHLKRHDPTP
jgi:predicted component of type VI protein secretion system